MPSISSPSAAMLSDRIAGLYDCRQTLDTGCGPACGPVCRTLRAQAALLQQFAANPRPAPDSDAPAIDPPILVGLIRDALERYLLAVNRSGGDHCPYAKASEDLN
ncbi:MAG TPA: hypothetical protein PKC18_07720, partial [Lacipirellulaceae bacterium]|nr:hypothetical protein [Lacipirellulaceae bacterium]